MAPGATIDLDDFDAYLSDDESLVAEIERLDRAGLSKAPPARLPSEARMVQRPAAQKNNTATTSNQSRLMQKDLFGKTVATHQPSTSHFANASAGPSGPVIRTVVRKQWDRTFYAKSGPARIAAKGRGKAGSRGKGKARARNEDDDDDEEDDDDDGENPMLDPEEAKRPPKPMKLLPDREACKTFVYPTNKSLRKYQYDIIAKAFFTDTLVALPTGLGKTFLAAVLMFNFYRWFPEGKIIFMAPSRPLVTQQISACHGIVGIPLKDAVELTGKDAPDRRAEAWNKRRVFYCTPQTVKNDLFKGRLDPSDVILMVIDEAHKATGDYAYCEVVRFMMQKNPHFRLLALTATPGGTAEVVQSVIDNLHIGHIEVRSDESFDTRQYIHNKRVDLVVVPVQGEIGSIRERFGGLMEILLKQVRDLVKTQKTDPTTMHPYLFQAANQNAKMAGKPWAYNVLASLGAMARCISKLLEQSVDSFFEDLQSLRKSAKGKMNEVVNHKDFASIYRDTEDIINGRGFAGHPKMVKLAELVQEHFESAKKDGTLESTRIMVFCTFRQVVEEIVKRLNAFDGIRATRLVGQGTDTKGKKGLGQKQQNKTLADFKGGDFNVLVATSIGEEGLDIGELDLIICYDAAKSPVRTLQRAGRTGRAREGRVVVLMTEGIEEDNWRIANSKYKDVQSAILSGKQFELYADCERLIPSDIRPVADKKELIIEPFDPEHMGLGRSSIATGRRKRDEADDISPFQTGFQKANGGKVDTKPIKARSKARAAVPSEPLATLEASGLLTKGERETFSMRKHALLSIDNTHRDKVREHTLPRIVPPATPASKRTLGTSARSASLYDALRVGQELSADSDKNNAWEIQTYSAFKSSNVLWWSEARVGRGRDRSFRPLGPIKAASSHTTSSSARTDRALHVEAPVAHAIMTGTHSYSSDHDLPDLPLSLNKSRSSLVQSAISQAGKGRSPTAVTKTATVQTLAEECLQDETLSRPKAGADADSTIITVDDSDADACDELDARTAVLAKAANGTSKVANPTQHIIDLDDSFDDDLDSSAWLALDLGPAKPIPPSKREVDEQAKPESPKVTTIARPNALFRASSDIAQDASDDSPIIARKTRSKRSAIVMSSPDKSVLQTQAQDGTTQILPCEDESVVLLEERLPANKRLRRAHDDKVQDTRSRKANIRQPQVEMFLDTAAVNSDHEDTASDTDEDILPETTSDRIFLDSEDVSNPSDMTMFYRRSLMSQAAGTFEGEVVRPGAYKMRVHRAKLLSDCEESPVEQDDSRNPLYEASQYERGSFCVDDSDEVIYSQREDSYLDDD